MGSPRTVLAGSGPRWVRTASEIAGPLRAPAVTAGESESEVTRHPPLWPRAAKQHGAGFEPLTQSRRGPVALANEARGRLGRASPSGSACDRRRHAGARLVVAGRGLRVPVASASGDLSVDSGRQHAALTCAIGVGSGRDDGTGRAFQARDRWGHIGATSGPRTTGSQRTTTITGGLSSDQLTGHTPPPPQVAAAVLGSLTRKRSPRMAPPWTAYNEAQGMPTPPRTSKTQVARRLSTWPPGGLTLEGVGSRSVPCLGRAGAATISEPWSPADNSGMQTCRSQHVPAHHRWPRTRLPALLRQRFGVRVPGGAPLGPAVARQYRPRP